MNTVLAILVGVLALGAWIYSLFRRIDTLTSKVSKSKYDEEYKDLMEKLGVIGTKVTEDERNYEDAKKAFTSKHGDGKSDS